jgi:hypothetical protein
MSNFLKKFFKTFAYVLAFILILFYLGSYGLSFPPCSWIQTDIQAPELMKTSDIVFEKPMYYYISPPAERFQPSRFKSCKNVRAEAKGGLTTDSVLSEYGYKLSPVNKDRFRLIEAVDLTGRGISDFEGSAGGRYFLLENPNGDRYYIRQLYLESGGATYYRNGVRIDRAKVD